MTAHRPIPRPDPTPRHDGWTIARQQTFLTALADGHTVESACTLVGLSPASAYALRRRPAGVAFALGWRAACLLARDALADILMRRVIDGQTDTYVRANGETVTRHRYDNRLATAMLTRLDRLADGPAAIDPPAAQPRAASPATPSAPSADPSATDTPRSGLRQADLSKADLPNADPPHLDAAQPAMLPAIAAARLVAADWEGFLTALAHDDPAITAGRYREAAANMVAAAAVGGVQPDAKGMSQLPQHRPVARRLRPGERPPEPQPVWYDRAYDLWVTRFPPPPAFTGREFGRYGNNEYKRALSPAELAVQQQGSAPGMAAATAHASLARDAWFGFGPAAPSSEPGK